MDRCFNLFVLSCAGHFVLVLQVGVKNIPNHNNLVPLCQLRDLAALKTYHEYPMYLYTKIRRLFQCMYTRLLKILCLILGQLWYMFFILDLLLYAKVHSNRLSTVRVILTKL